MTKISLFSPAGSLTGAEEVPVVQDGVTLRTTSAAIAGLAGGGYETLAAAAAASIPIALDQIYIQGYYAAGDGGDGYYKRVGADPSHSLKFTDADGAFWELVPYDVGIGLKQAGAKGDASTDDTTAIQNAFNAAAAGLGGRAVFVSGDTFVITNLTIDSGVTLYGLGWINSVFQLKSGSGGAMISANAKSQVTIRDIGIHGLGGSSSTPSNAIKMIGNCVGWVIENVTGNSHSGSGLIVTGLVNYVRRFFGSSLCTGIPNRSSLAAITGGIHVSGSDHVFQNCETSCGYAQHPNVDPNDPSNYAWCFYSDAYTVHISDCIFEFSQNGFRSSSSSGENRLINNRADQNALNGFFVEGLEHILIGNASYGNNYSNTTGVAYYLWCNQSTLIGNTFFVPSGRPAHYEGIHNEPKSGGFAIGNPYLANKISGNKGTATTPYYGTFWAGEASTEWNWFKTSPNGPPTPNVQSIHKWNYAVNDASSRSITNWGGYDPGQELIVENNNSGVLTLKHNDTSNGSTGIMSLLPGKDIAFGANGRKYILKESGGTFYHIDTYPRYVTGTKSAWDPASVANGAQTSTTLTVTGAAIADPVYCQSSIALSGLRLWGEVTSGNTVTLYLSNNTGGAVDLGAMDVYVQCDKAWNG